MCIRDRVPDDKLKGYVLDLRLNPGGLLDQAVSVSDTFLDLSLIHISEPTRPY